MIMLDYSNCGKTSEPTVIHVDQESDYRKTFLAENFETFIRGLISSDTYDTSTGFVEGWIDEKLRNKEIVNRFWSGLTFSKKYAAIFLNKVKKYE